jgi:hypothetical protein
MMKWQPIETAPKDGTRVILFRPTARSWAQIITGKFNLDIYASKMRPYWDTDIAILEGKSATRSNAPTHWMPLPEPPCAE